jgi:hypothetical protein
MGAYTKAELLYVEALGKGAGLATGHLALDE